MRPWSSLTLGKAQALTQRTLKRTNEQKPRSADNDLESGSPRETHKSLSRAQLCSKGTTFYLGSAGATGAKKSVSTPGNGATEGSLGKRLAKCRFNLDKDELQVLAQVLEERLPNQAGGKNGSHKL